MLATMPESPLLEYKFHRLPLYEICLTDQELTTDGLFEEKPTTLQSAVSRQGTSGLSFFFVSKLGYCYSMQSVRVSGIGCLMILPLNQLPYF